MVNFKNVTHYGPRSGFMHYILTTPIERAPSIRGSNEQLCVFESWKSSSVPSNMLDTQDLCPIHHYKLNCTTSSHSTTLNCKPDIVIAQHLYTNIFQLFGWFRVLNTTFNNISVISWRSVLLVVETIVPGENHRPVASH